MVGRTRDSWTQSGGKSSWSWPLWQRVGVKPRGLRIKGPKRKPEDPALPVLLMEEICQRENLRKALQRVRQNKGSPGIDGMTVKKLSGYLRKHWPGIRERLLMGTYSPEPAKRVEIPKPDSGTRKLGIPTVLDRFIQQAIMQVLQKYWDKTFSEHSFGFRPGRSAHQAILKKIIIVFSDNPELVVVLVVISNDLIAPENHKYSKQNIL